MSENGGNTAALEVGKYGPKNGLGPFPFKIGGEINLKKREKKKIAQLEAITSRFACVS